MDKISKFSGNKKIIDSGAFVTNINDNNYIKIQRDAESIIFKIVFKEDQQSFNLKSSGEKNEEKNEVTVTLEVYNLKGPFGGGFSEPAQLAGFDNGDKIYLFMWFKNLGSGNNKEISYTIYLEEK